MSHLITSMSSKYLLSDHLFILHKQVLVLWLKIPYKGHHFLYKYTNQHEIKM